MWTSLAGKARQKNAVWGTITYQLKDRGKTLRGHIQAE
jgi:hypothetical protein